MVLRRLARGVMALRVENAFSAASGKQSTAPEGCKKQISSRPRARINMDAPRAFRE